MKSVNGFVAGKLDIENCFFPREILMKLRNVCPIEHEMLSASFLSGPLKTPRDQLVPSSYLTVRYNYGLQLAEYADYFRYTRNSNKSDRTKR